VYYLIYSLFWLISLIPLRILYFFSDILYLIIYYIFPYRKKVVYQNIRNSFPDKSENDIRKMVSRFYRFFCDLFVEIPYSLHMSEKEMFRRTEVVGIELIEKYYAEGKSVLIMASHYANWEWGTSLSALLPEDKPAHFIYKKLSSNTFDRLFRTIRGHFHGQSVEMKELLRKMVDMRNSGKVGCFFLVSDQTPTRKNTHYWTTFLNQDTPVIDGTEQLAKKFDYPVLMIDQRRVKRGYYRGELKLITDTPKETAPFEISEKYMRMLEEQIVADPSCWLWTHRRWKHKKEI